MPAYSSFADYYDALMEDARYSERCDYLLSLLKRHGNKAGYTLDLACGTGSLAIELKKRGVEVFGADASVEMLSEAMQKSLEQGLHILFVNQKMQELDLPEKIDTCFCTLDSINHITDEETLQTAFNRLGGFMETGGLFVFDVNTVYKHRKVLGDNAFIIENDRVFCAWQNTLEENDIVSIDLDFFERDGSVYYRQSENFCERAYSDTQLRTMLKAAGFAVEAVYGDFTFDEPAHDEQRAVYVARRIKENGEE
ncbi:MAG TPA: class I SAM-dependent methyltransferase [Ruminococcaceae bacterium]|nr:class I SAM-dependent methyltransferase [Oscillospiraceae bacterium]